MIALLALSDEGAPSYDRALAARLAGVGGARTAKVKVAEPGQGLGDDVAYGGAGHDLIDERDPLLEKMIAENERTGLTVIALMEVDPEHVHLYGVASVEPTDDPDVVRVTGLVEKPKREDAPSNYAVIGRYVLTPQVFDILERTAPGKGGDSGEAKASRSAVPRVPRK